MEESITTLDYTNKEAVRNSLDYKTFTKETGRNELIHNGVIRDFLHTHLEEYGDSKEAIQLAIDYIFDKEGGMIKVQFVENEISGVCLVNRTGMGGYIPENILVYIANQKKFRGAGLGKDLMSRVIKEVEGDVALHVEKNNPAIRLYEKLGFTNPYLEMRLKK